MFSEDYKRGVCLDDLDVGLDWNALIKHFFSERSKVQMLLHTISKIIAGNVFSDAPYFVRGVSISQDVCLCVCPRHFQFRVENYTLKLHYALLASYSLVTSLSNKFVSSFPI